jgi:glycosyltransferase involved in cell wall biosynthesis
MAHGSWLTACVYFGDEVLPKTAFEFTLPMIKVAMIVRSTLYTVRGGDTIQVVQTAANLVAKNIPVEIKLTNEDIDYKKYDVLHFFNITRPADILYHIKRSGKPFVVSTILIDYSEYDKQHRKGLSGILFRFFSHDGIEYIKTISRWLLGKDKLMSLDYLWQGQRRSVTEILNKAKLLLPNSHSEYQRLHNRYHFNTGYIVVTNGVESSLFAYDETIKKDPDLVLCVARIEGIKNQLNLIKGLNNTRFKLVIIGAASPNQRSYSKECRMIAASNISFIDHMPQEELVNYYQRAKVHVLPSWFETTGLSSLEAAAMGCSIVITEKGDTREYFCDDAVYCDPSSPENIFAAVEKASLLRFNESFQKKILALYSWEQATIHTMEAYERIKNIWD